jgi:HEAT repeat protein
MGVMTMAAVAAEAQTRAPVPAGGDPQAAALAQGWALLAKGDTAGASRVAWQELARSQGNPAALMLAVDAELTRAGGAAGLGAYEKWLGTRRLDEAYVLRRVARRILADATGKQPNAAARLEALRALAADGHAEASATLERAASSSRIGETRALASTGDERAVKLLIAQLKTTPGSKTQIIDALGDSGSPAAVAPLKGLLSSQDDLTRASAADALGRLNATDAVPQLRPLLKDPIFTVRLKTAGALLRLNDTSGLALLTDLSTSEHAGVRVAAARELSSQPDGSWQNLVRSLANDPDPTVRLEAARLIAPYDQPLAKTVLDGLMSDDNIGIREAASGVLVDRVASDFATLRGLLRSPDVMVRVKAGARILELTR